MTVPQWASRTQDQEEQSAGHELRLRLLWTVTMGKGCPVATEQRDILLVRRSLSAGDRTGPWARWWQGNDSDWPTRTQSDIMIAGLGLGTPGTRSPARLGLSSDRNLPREKRCTARLQASG